MNNPMIDCPFNACSWRGEVVIEQATAGDDETTLRRVPVHDLVPNPEYGSCPASLMALPVDKAAQDNLHNASHYVALWRGDAGLPQREPGAAEPAIPQHSKTPRPERGSDRWFRGGSTGDGAHRTDLGPLGYERAPLGKLPVKIENSRGGSQVASVAEVRAALDQAAELTAEGQGIAQAAMQKFTEAAALINWVRQTSVDPIGIHELTIAADKCQDAFERANVAIEQNRTYASTL